MIRQNKDHLKSESVAHFRLHHPLLILSLHTPAHTHCAWSHSEATHTHGERERQKNEETHKVICLLAFFFCLSCLAGEQECSLLLHAGTHTLSDSKCAHTDSENKQVN